MLALIPERMGVTGFVYSMGLMSAVTFSWEVMLILADFKPIEGKWVLSPTILVVFLLGVTGVYAGITNLIPVPRVIESSAAAVMILSLLIYAWFKTRAT